MQTAAYASYRTITTQTAGPGELLLQLYQAAIKNIGQARLAIEAVNVPDAHKHIVRAQEILLELQRTLDHEQGGDLAPRLDALYGFMRGRLFDANMRKEIGPLDEVQGLLRSLLAAWQIAVRQSAR